MAQLQLETGDSVEISSSYGMVIAIAQPDPELRRGVVSLSRGWGGHPGETEGPGQRRQCAHELPGQRRVDQCHACYVGDTGQYFSREDR